VGEGMQVDETLKKQIEDRLKHEQAKLPLKKRKVKPSIEPI
jgi:hypothetical protein